MKTVALGTLKSKLCFSKRPNSVYRPLRATESRLNAFSFLVVLSFGSFVLLKQKFRGGSGAHRRRSIAIANGERERLHLKIGLRAPTVGHALRCVTRPILSPSFAARKNSAHFCRNPRLHAPTRTRLNVHTVYYEHMR